MLPELVQLVRLEVKLLLQIGKVLLHLVSLLFFLLQLHLQLSLLFLLFGQLLPGLLEFLLLSFGDFHDLTSNQHLLFHFLKLLDQLLLLGLGLLFGFLLLLQLLKQLFLFLFFQMRLILDILPICFGLQANFFLLLVESLFEFSHLFLVDNDFRSSLRT